MWDLIRFVWRHPLNARGRLAALGRVLRWQIATRLMPGPIALPYVSGTWLLATRGMAGATGNWYCGLHELDSMGFALHLLRPDDHFIDAGANVGSYTILAAGAAQARVTAFEPIPATFACLERNVALNRLDKRVRCLPFGVSDAPGTLRFTPNLDTVNHVLARDEPGPSIEVEVVRLDDVVRNDPPVLLKIDVEGHELAVLRGAQDTIRDPTVLALILEINGSGTRYGIADSELVGQLAAHGFQPLGYDPLARRLVPARATPGNTIFVRDRQAVRSRVETAARFALVNGTI